MMAALNNKIIALLKQEGCNIVGFADLRGLSKEARQNFVLCKRLYQCIDNVWFTLIGHGFERIKKRICSDLGF